MHIDKDVWAGLFFMGLAAAGLIIGADYAFGTPARMGAGFLPRLLCFAMLGLGAIITLTGIIRRGEPMEAWSWGQLLAILGAVMVFGATLETVGLEIAILGAVLVGCVADPVPTRSERTGLAILCICLGFYLWPGTLGRLGTTLGIPLPSIVLAATGALSVLIVASHARRVAPAIFLERIALGLGLGIASTIIFVDGLSLAMKSLFVIDAWTFLKSAVFKPIFQLFY